ncbi:MAG: hypothetical protein H0T79_23275 [Deltaproteobacteria bacterium]|nr:hypothetical protein [Deltaproteobacteria bacterium]
MRPLIISCLVALATLAIGNKPVRAEQFSISIGAPPLVYVQPGISVIPDYDVPVFYGDGYYWRWNDGYWYRSNRYTHGWAFDPTPPRAILRIDRPDRYVHYRPYGYSHRYRPLPQRDGRLYRDHRGYRDYRYSPYARPAPRVHRWDRDRYYHRDRYDRRYDRRYYNDGHRWH